MRKMSIQYLDNPGAMDFGQISTLLTEYGAGRSELDRTGAEKAFANTSGCASCSALYINRDEASISTMMIKREDASWFLFS